jgi:hypothetical protein
MYTDKKLITNIFHTGTVEINMTECFEAPCNWNPKDCTSKIITICNVGTKAVYVRVKLMPKWEDGLSTHNVHFEPEDSNWVKIGCYYYYKYILGAEHEAHCNKKCVTLKLCVCLSGCSGNEYQGKMFSLGVEAEAVQAKNHAVGCEWHLSERDLFDINFECYPQNENDCEPCCEPKPKHVPCCEPKHKYEEHNNLYED